jgi:hypothetical protein
MNVIMVAEDINKDGSFKQTRGELMCMVSSLAFIKHFYPHFKTTFFVDRFTKEYYKSFGILDLFDEVNDTLLDQKVLIDKNIFWAAGKIMAQKETKGPTLTLDLDFWLFSDIEKLGVFDSDVSCLWVEEINDEYYQRPEVALRNSGLGWNYGWGTHALNVSFLYLRDEEFKNEYCDIAIDYMKSKYNKIPKGLSFKEKTKHILFAEQYMLNELVKLKDKRVKVLVDDFYDFKDLNYVSSVGVGLGNCGYHLYHMGNHKEQFVIETEFAKKMIDSFYLTTVSHTNNEKFINVIEKLYNN